MGMYVASNPTALSAQFQLTRNMGALSDTLTRLSTGLRINSGKDDPAGLIASELLKAQITGTNRAITNTQRATGLIATADASLGQISNLLNDIKGLTVEAAQTGTMTEQQLMANQLQVDAAINSIDRIARTTNFGGQKLLDGTMDFRTAGMGGGISNLRIDSANFGTATQIGVNVNVQQQADYARLISNGTGVGVATVFDVIGNVGSATVSLGANATNDEIAAAINRSTDSTGVLAYVEGKEERGSIILSSAGANNDIVITALNKGLDAGNFTFRITQGATNDVRIVADPTRSQPGIVEIQLVAAEEAVYDNFANLFNISIDQTGDRRQDDGTSINMTRGTSNLVQYFAVDTNATGQSRTSNIMLTVDAAAIGAANDATGTDGITTSMFNGWTVTAVAAGDRRLGTGAGEAPGTGNHGVDLDSKTIFVMADAANGIDEAGVAAAFSVALGTTIDADVFDFRGVVGPQTGLLIGDSLTLRGGGNAGELFIQYREGATAGEILTMLNNAPGVSASFASGVNARTEIGNLPSRVTFESRTAAQVVESRYQAGATAQDVIDMINSKLGDMFMASGLAGGGTQGRMTFMDASATVGNVNLGNALQFTGMDNGPVIRMSTTNLDGSRAINQQLGIQILQPSQADVRAGITTPILNIMLATDNQGNSITTARDIQDLFNRLTAQETLGVSAAVLFPPGVDPNGRIFGTGECGRPVVIETCPEGFGFGIVQPTGTMGPCGTIQGDIMLLGNNQRIVADYAFARINSEETTTYNNALGESEVGGGILGWGATSSMNGISVQFTEIQQNEGFDATTGVLTVFLRHDLEDANTAGLDGDELTDRQNANLYDTIDARVAADWEAIRAFTGSTELNAVKLVRPPATENPPVPPPAGATTITLLQARAGALAEGSDTPHVWVVSDDDGEFGTGIHDHALTITARDRGTDMAGVNIFFIADDRLDVNTIAVEFRELENGEKQLLIRGNVHSNDDRTAVPPGTENLNQIHGSELVKLLNANADFNRLFVATAGPATLNAGAPPTDHTEDASRVAFRSVNTNNPHAVTEGGFRIESNQESLGVNNTTSSGVVMRGQSDNNERLVIESAELGSGQFVRINVREGMFHTVNQWGQSASDANGFDMQATINGIRATASGNTISINTPDLALSMNVANMQGRTGFNITGGGALFQLGPDVVTQQQTRIGIGSMLSTNLGGASGTLHLLRSGNIAALNSDDQGRRLADRIVNEAIESVATTRGRLGAIQRGTLEPNILALQDSLTALTESNAQITNADFAVESSNLTRFQLLIQAGMQTLGIANQMPQYAAQLVR